MGQIECSVWKDISDNTLPLDNTPKVQVSDLQTTFCCCWFSSESKIKATPIKFLNACPPDFHHRYTLGTADALGSGKQGQVSAGDECEGGDSDGLRSPA